MKRCPAGRRGFTLVEIIVTLTILSILGVIVFQFMRSSLVRSTEPFSIVAQTFALHEVTENIMADYRQTGDVPALKDRIGTEGSEHINSGYCPAAADCRYSVVDNHYIAFDDEEHEIPAPESEQKLLKVTIRGKQNETITMVFYQP